MNRIGMIVDLAHVAITTMHAALDVTSKPVIFSHSSARARVDNPRNVPDDVLHRLPSNGGVCQVAFVPCFVSEACWAWPGLSPAVHAGAGPQRGRCRRGRPFLRPVRRSAAASPSNRRRRRGPHRSHPSLAGVAHVGLGADYDGADALPEGLGDVSCYPRLIGELTSRLVRFGSGQVDLGERAQGCGGGLRLGVRPGAPAAPWRRLYRRVRSASA